MPLLKTRKPRKSWAKPPIPKICPQCDGRFSTTYSEQVYCSRLCGDSSRRVPVADRFFAKVVKTDTCWLYPVSTKKYGLVWDRSEPTNQITAHRFSYKLHHGDIPDGMMVCHRCDVPNCVNPEHLFLGSALDNVQDMIHKQRRNIAHTPNKLTAEIVRQIRAEKNQMSYSQLAAKFGICISMAHSIVHRKTWSHID